MDIYKTINHGNGIIEAHGEKGAIFWYKNGIFHKEDGPAIEYPSGYKEWHIDGLLHREDGPAVEYPNGNESWYLNGVLHRENGPAIHNKNKYKEWYKNGLRHRDNDLPAVEACDGRKEWYVDGKRHRDGGPAILPTEISRRNKEWYQFGRLHREDGPAIQGPTKYHKRWYINGEEIDEETFENIKEQAILHSELQKELNNNLVDNKRNKIKI